MMCGLFMHNAGFITLPVAVFFSSALVMQLLAFNQSNFQFR